MHHFVLEVIVPVISTMGSVVQLASAKRCSDHLTCRLCRYCRHWGPILFFARLKNAGIDLHLPEGAEPGLPMILGGVSLRLTDLVSAFTALGNDGRTMRLRFRSNDAVSDRYLLSSESAYIIRRILSDAPRPSDFCAASSAFCRGQRANDRISKTGN
jgi:hypothetical protein